MKRLFVPAAAAAVLFAFSCAPGGDSAETVDRATIESWMTELSNWGRWGADDQRGTVNLITPEKRVQAAALVQEGVSVSLSHDLLTEKADDNPNPFEHDYMAMNQDPNGSFVGDHYGIAYHGHAHSHMDALTHMGYQGKTYNGFSQSAPSVGHAEHEDITQFKNGIFTRGVLMDIPRLKGVEYLEPGTPIYPEDLAAWEKQAGFTVQPGDVVLIRTGRWKARAAKGPWNISQLSAGLHASCAKWLHERDIAVIGSEDSSDLLPSGIDGITQPIHLLFLVAMGTPIFDNLDLDALAEEAVRQNRWEFLVTAGPLAVEGGTGSPLNPIATF